MSENALKDQNKEAETSSVNIFDEFATDSSLIDEVEKLKEEEKKDTYYYLSLSWKIFQNIFWFLFVVVVVLYGYIYIQKSDSFVDKSLLDPICFIFNDTTISKPEGTTYCSSISFLKKTYESNLENIKLDQSKKILENIIKIYEDSNFTKTKEVTFLLNKTDDRLSVLDIIEKFDLLKNDFWWIDKRKVQCEKIKIDIETKIMEMQCYSYSQWYEKWIIWFSWIKNTDEIWGTSITIANSFLNYIEKNSKDFSLLERQKVFEIQNVSWETNGYTNKTSFDVKLKINF